MVIIEAEATDHDGYTAANCDSDRKTVVLALMRIATYRIEHPQFGGPSAPLLKFAAELWDGAHL